MVTRDVSPYALMVGNPARQVGWMSRAGGRLQFDETGQAICPETGEAYLKSTEGYEKITLLSTNFLG